MSRIFRIVYLVMLHTICSNITNVEAKSIYLKNWGILEEQNPMKTYWILYNAHSKAASLKTIVDYTDIDSLCIEIPYNGSSIPLTYGCNFKGVKLSVINKVKNFELFIIKNIPKPVKINCNQIDRGNFKDINELQKGRILLSIVDSSAWVKERIGYGYPFYRKDIFLLKNGISTDRPIMNYNDSLSRPFGFYSEVNDVETEVCNIEISRSNQSTFKTICFSIDYAYKLKLNNLTITTPESNLYADEAIRIRNSYNIVFSDIRINGTYSQKDKYGYGISMNNVSDIRFINLNADANWGIFGNNNVKNICIVNSDINRFDVHCYGKDVDIKNTVFRKYYNQVCSFFGEIKFNNCKFYDFKPLIIGDSYQLNTKFTVSFHNCFIELNKPKASLIYIGKSTSQNDRKYLQRVNWPNLTIYNTKIISNIGNSFLDIFESTDKEPIAFDDIIRVNIERCIVEGFKKVDILNNMSIFNKDPLQFKILIKKSNFCL